MKTLYDFTERIGELLRVNARQAGLEYELQPVQMQVLRYLAMCNRFSDTPMAVTEYLGQTKGTVSQTISLLQKRGLIEKISDTEDKRVVRLKLTDKGKKLITKIAPDKVFLRACDELSVTEQESIKESLSELLRAMQSANDMNTFGTCKSCRYNRKLSERRYHCGLVDEPLTIKEIELICREHESLQVG